MIKMKNKEIINLINDSTLWLSAGTNRGYATYYRIHLTDDIYFSFSVQLKKLNGIFYFVIMKGNSVSEIKSFYGMPEKIKKIVERKIRNFGFHH